MVVLLLVFRHLQNALGGSGKNLIIFPKGVWLRKRTSPRRCFNEHLLVRCPFRKVVSVVLFVAWLKCHSTHSPL
jgi:hypothetical protein